MSASQGSMPSHAKTRMVGVGHPNDGRAGLIHPISVSGVDTDCLVLGFMIEHAFLILLPDDREKGSCFQEYRKLY